MSCFWSISVFISMKNNAVCGDLIIFQHFLGGTYMLLKLYRYPWSLVLLVFVEKHPPTHKKHLQTCLHNILNCRQQLPPPIWTNERVDKPLIKLKFLVPISGGCGAMYEIFIESEEFRGKRQVQQHRLVNQVS